MKLFLDTADTELIEKHFQTDLIDGITTNPTLIMKSGRDPEEVYQQLIDMGIDDISMEVVGDVDEMYMEGVRLSRKFGKNATIKVPCTPAGLKVCKKLSRDLVNVKVTLIFSAAQAILAAKAGAKYVSPFVGRVDDNSFDGMELIDQISNSLSDSSSLSIRIATVYFKPLKQKVPLQPDYFLHETNNWLVFPHELQGLSNEEVAANKPIALGEFYQGIY